MSDENGPIEQELGLETASPESTFEKPNELAELKQRADLMGISYHPNIGVAKLKAKVEAKIRGEQSMDEDEAAAEEAATITTAEEVAKGRSFTRGQKPTAAELAMKRRQDALRLVRVRVTCMNPAKSNWKGEILSVGNSELGMVKKYVPFNADQGWHIPNIMLGMLRDRKYLTHYEVKVGNKRIKKTRLVPEFAVEVLEPLTAKELHDLKQRQIMAQAGKE